MLAHELKIFMKYWNSVFKFEISLFPSLFMGVRKETFTIARPKIQHIVDNNFNLCMSGSDKLQTVCVGVWCVPNDNPSNDYWDISPTNVTLMDKMLGDDGFFTWIMSICIKLNGHPSSSWWDVGLDPSGGHWTGWLTDFAVIVEKKTFCNSISLLI